MKKLFLIVPVIALMLASCNDKWDTYYQNNYSTVEVDLTVAEFLASKPEYSDFNHLIEQMNLQGELKKNQLVTVWAISNSNLAITPIDPSDTIRVKYHINNLAFGYDELKDGLRIRSINGIYFEINQKTDGYYVNNVAKLIKTYRLKDGIVNEISEALVTRINLYNYIKNLSDDYSIIRDTIFKNDKMVFDASKSIPIGVDVTGNTIYDSVFVVQNPFFAKANFISEFEQYTALIPSNQVIKNCLNRMTREFTLFGLTATKADSVKAWAWIKEAVFYKGVITDFTPLDIPSVYNRIWRTSVQALLPNSTTLSNGLVYMVDSMKIPRNVVGGGKIKSFFHYWEYLTPEEKAEWAKLDYKTKKDSGTFRVVDDGDSPSKANTYLTTDRTRDDYWCLHIGYETTDAGYYTTDSAFTVTLLPLERYFEGTTPRARVMKVPPGEYNFYMGVNAANATSHPKFKVYFNNEFKMEVAPISNPWNFDRNTSTHTVSRWDGYGGLVGTITIPGTQLTSFEMKLQWSARSGSTGYRRFRLYHWTLVPTANNY